MKTNQHQPADAAGLRRRAEERLKRQRPEGGGQKTKLETARLVHELEVHQIELEMQNEELQQTRARAEALLAQYTDLYEFAPTGYFNLARDGTILAVNLTGARLLGLERAQLLNRRLGLLVAEADRPVFNACLEKTFAGKDRECCERKQRRSLFASRLWFPRASGSAALPCWMSPTATGPRQSRSDWFRNCERPWPG
jgi:PAS domain-containing protein